MSELRDRAQELLAAGAFRKYVLDEYARLREKAAEAFREDGITEQRIVAADGVTYLGMLSVGEPTVTVAVEDDDAMLDYMLHVHPEEMVEVTTYHITPPFWAKIVAASKKARTGVDPVTGKSLPWVKVVVSPGEIRVTPSSAARERVREVVEKHGITKLELEP